MWVRGRLILPLGRCRFILSVLLVVEVVACSLCPYVRLAPLIRARASRGLYSQTGPLSPLGPPATLTPCPLQCQDLQASIAAAPSIPKLFQPGIAASCIALSLPLHPPS